MGDDLGLLSDGLVSADVYQLLYQLMVALNLGLEVSASQSCIGLCLLSLIWS